MKTLRLNRREDRRVLGGHLWIYSNEVDSTVTPLGDFQPGEQVLVESSGGRILGTAYINPRSLICARLISREERRLDYEVLLQRLELALKLRERLFDEPCYRLVYGEGDLLPGLVVDRFGPHLSVQIATAGMEALQNEVIDALRNLLQPASILLKNDIAMRELEGLSLDVTAAFGSPPEEVELVENGVRFIVPFLHGQKTGWFYDQRVNRKMATAHCKDMRVLDVFSYAGGFAVQAAASGAREVWAVDASRAALETAERNMALNSASAIFTGAHGDGFEVLKALREEEEFFDVIIVDPPAFIKKKKDHREGLRAYRRINELALKLLQPRGIVLSASCSMHLSRDELMEVLRGCAQGSSRHIRILAEGSQGPDHPIHPAIPETRYLKALLACVD